MHFKVYYEHNDNALFCLFIGNETMMQLDGILYLSDSQPIRRILITHVFQFQLFQLFFKGYHSCSFTYLSYIIYLLLISYIYIIWDLKSKHTSK